MDGLLTFLNVIGRIAAFIIGGIIFGFLGLIILIIFIIDNINIFLLD